MRVLVLTNLYPPNAMGGYEMSCRDVVDRWRSRGHDVTVLTTAGRIAGVVEPEAVEPHVRRQLEWYWKEHAFLRPSRAGRIALERHNHDCLQAALRDVEPDVVSVWHMGGMSLSLLTTLENCRVPVVCNICDEWPSYGPLVDAWSLSWSRRPTWLRRLGSRVTGLPTTLPQLDQHPASFVSAFTRERVREKGVWQFPSSTVVGSGVDTEDFPIVETPPGRPWAWQLLAVGRIEPRKGFDVAVSALVHLPPQARLRLVGVADPEYRSELQGLAAICGVEDRVSIGAVARRDLRQIYADADAVLFTSRWEEPFGLVPLEAMTQATPVVATRRGGSAEFLVDRVNCLEIPIDDPVALAAAVQELATDAVLRERLVEGGLRTAGHYTVDRLALVLEELHAVTADGPRPGTH